MVYVGFSRYRLKNVASCSRNFSTGWVGFYHAKSKAASTFTCWRLSVLMDTLARSWRYRLSPSAKARFPSGSVSISPPHIRCGRALRGFHSISLSTSRLSLWPQCLQLGCLSGLAPASAGNHQPRGLLPRWRRIIPNPAPPAQLFFTLAAFSNGTKPLAISASRAATMSHRNRVPHRPGRD